MSRPSSTSDDAMSVGRSQRPGCSGCGLRVFFGIFFIAGLATFYFLTFRPLWGVLSAQGWDETPCTILTSELERNRGDDGDTFRIAITYSYEYEGQPYTGDRYHFLDMNSNTGMKWKQNVVGDHPPGRQTTCFVNPASPQEAVIHRGLTGEMWWGLFPIPFLAVGIGGIFFAPRLVEKQTTAGSTSTTSPAGATSASSFVAASADDGPVELKPEHSPLTMFLISLFVCLFWNGITSLFVVQIVRSFLDGDPEWFLTVFMIPFVLIGLAILAWVGYSFLSLFNPRPELKLSRARLPLGSMGRINWTFRGNVRSVRNLKLSLLGVEQATYRRGTSTHTDTETFFEHVFYEADHPVYIAQGEAEFEIPADSMHTFEADSNEILWSLQVAGDVPFWPDVSISYPIEVTPHEPVAD